jgi:hypothetical protein
VKGGKVMDARVERDRGGVMWNLVTSVKVIVITRSGVVVVE